MKTGIYRQSWFLLFIVSLLGFGLLGYPHFMDGAVFKHEKKIAFAGGNVPDDSLEYAAFAMGCFWHVQLLFSRVKGVEDTVVGYMGGQAEDPTYQQVCSGNTGHAETLLVAFDPEQVTYKDLLRLFWDNHDPTTGNRQGPDVGTQYRSAIFYFNDTQRHQAQESLNLEQYAYEVPITTHLLPAADFYRAEDYHQNYLAKRGLDRCGE